MQIKSAELSVINEDFDNVKESIGMPMLVVDNDLVITLFNKAAWDIFTLNEDSKGNALTAVATQIDVPDLRKNVMAVIKKGNIFTRQLESHGMSYFERIEPYRDEHGVTKGAVLTYVDNTQEQKILQELTEVRERYDLALEGSNAGIWDWDITTGEMHWSGLFRGMLGITKSSFIPSIKKFEALIHEDDRDDVMSIIQAHLQRGFEFNVEFRMRKENEDYIWVQMRGQATWDESKRPMRMTGSVYDVSNRRQALDHLSRTNESLERFAYVCSHDLKEPARIIENFVTLFTRQYGETLDERASEYLAFIQDSSVRMQEMIKGILTYSQLENKNLKLDEIDLEEEIGKVKDNLKLSIEEKGADVTHDSLPAIKGDKMQIFQVLQNLIGNSLKFCRDGTPHVHVSADETADDWILCVRDNGIGMKPEYTHKIFNVFQRLNQKEEYEGSGIGLSICQKIVSKHGGRIWVESELGKGSEFFFSIPKKKKRGVMQYGS